MKFQVIWSKFDVTMRFWKKSWKNGVNRDEMRIISRHDRRSRQSGVQNATEYYKFNFESTRGHPGNHSCMFNSFLGGHPSGLGRDGLRPSELDRNSVDSIVRVGRSHFRAISSTYISRVVQNFTCTETNTNRVHLNLKILIPPRLEPTECRERWSCWEIVLISSLLTPFFQLFFQNRIVTSKLDQMTWNFIDLLKII